MTDATRGEKGDKGEKGEPGRDSDSGFRGAVNTIFRSIGVGAGGGSIAGLVAMFTDPTGYNAKAAGMVGVILGLLNGLSEVWIRNRRGLREADAEPNYVARLAAERVTADTLRHLDECHAESARLSGRVDTLELNVQLAHRENQKLTADVVDLAKRLAALDGRKA